MNKNISYLIPLSLIIFGCSTEPKDTNYPESKKIDFVETIHGYEIRDDYRGLKILQVMNQKLGLMSKIDLLKILLDKINTRGQLQKI